MKKTKLPQTLTGNYFQSNLSPKIKLEINPKKSLEDLPNEKITISLGKKKSQPQAILQNKSEDSNSPNNKIKPIKPVVLDQQLFKQFKNDSFHKVDLHGCTVDEAHQKVLSYLTNHSKKKNLLHIVITGLGNKSNGDEFFTGKIRKQFPLWLETEPFQIIVKSYSSCKIKHGGLGAFYVKLRTA